MLNYQRVFSKDPSMPKIFPWQFPWHFPGLRLFRAWLPQAVDHSVVAGHFPHGVDVGIAGAEAAVHLDSASTVTKPWGSWHMSTYHGFVEHISYVYPIVYPLHILCISIAFSKEFSEHHQFSLFFPAAGSDLGSRPRWPSSRSQARANSSRGRMPQETIKRSRSRWNGAPSCRMGPPSDSVQLVYKWLNSMVYGRYNYS